MTADKNLRIFDLVRLMFAHKKWVIGITTAFAILGVTVALLSPPVYHSEAIIAIKEQEGKSMNSVFSQLGGLAGLSLGNSNQTWISIIARNREIADTVLRQLSLKKELYPDLWNKKKGTWDVKDSAEIPSDFDAIEKLRIEVINIANDAKNDVIVVSAETYSPVLAQKIVTGYLDALREKLKRDIISESMENKAYLDSQLQVMSDPWMKEKVMSLIGNEIERGTLLRTRPFQVLEYPIASIKPVKPKKARIVVVFTLMGIASSAAFLAFLYYRKQRGPIGGKTLVGD